MKNVIYFACKSWIRLGLFFYFKKTKILGTENIPSHKSIVFVGNHQNALLDSLSVAVNCRRSPYFMSRSDIFRKGFLQFFLNAIRLIPVYRIRDGIGKITGNYEVFKKTAVLLQKGNSIVIFPEGNHSLKRRVRPLSKGFTRILFAALEENPDLDIWLVPVGVNYVNAIHFTDKVFLHFGKAIPVQEYYNASDKHSSTVKIKEAVSSSLKTLTTHIEDTANYDAIERYLNGIDVNYLEPQEVNKKLQNISMEMVLDSKQLKTKHSFLNKTLDFIFVVANFPMVFVWRKVLKPKVMEKELRSTVRFLFSLIFFPVFYVFLFLICCIWLEAEFAFYIIFGYIFLNLMYVKLR